MRPRREQDASRIPDSSQARRIIPMALPMHAAACPAEPVTAQTKEPQSRWARRSAWLLWTVTLVVAAAGLALMVWDWRTPVPSGSFGVRGFSGLWAVGFGGVGALLTRRRPGHPVGWVFAAAGMLAAVDFASFEYALAAVVGHRDLPAGEYVGWLQLWIWVPFVSLITVYLPLLFPDGRLPWPRWRPAAWAAGGCGVMAVAGLAITPGVVANLTALRNPFGVHPAAGSTAAIAAGLAGLLGCTVLAVWSLFVRARRGTFVERQQIKWLTYAGCLVAAMLLPSTILSQSTGLEARIVEGALMIAILTVPVAVAVAVLRYRLYAIDRVISRSLSYAIVTGLLAGIYAGLVLLATQVLRFSSPVAVAGATLAAAALFNPARRLVQHAVDRRFNRARYDAETTVAAFAARLKDAVDLDAVRDDLASVVQTVLEPASVWVWTGQRGRPSRNPADLARPASPDEPDDRPGGPRAVRLP
jgi:hypothetical protein